MKLTESSERTTVRRGLDGLKPYLAAYISQNSGAIPSSQADTAELLKSLLEGWDRVYGRRLPRVVRSYVHELLDVRNRWAHEQPFSPAEAARALDTVRQLRVAIGAPDPAVGSTSTATRGARAKNARLGGSGQRAVMREIYSQFGDSEPRIISEYAAAERSGRVQRKGQKSGYTPEEYAKALLADGLRKGWLK